MIRGALKNLYLVVVLVLMVAVVGLVSAARIPADLLPTFTTSAVQIVCFFPGMPPEVMEQDIMSRLQRWSGQSAGISLPALAGQALTSRPELGAAGAQITETTYRTRQELLRPWLPNLYVGFNADGFGGGAASFLGNFSDRTDFDAVAAWELRNFGLGNRATVRRQASRNRQARLDRAQVRDQVVAEVTSAFHQARLR